MRDLKFFIKELPYIFVTFCLVFYFKTYNGNDASLLDSTIVIGILILLLLLVCKGGIKSLIRTITDINNFKIVAFCSFLSLISLVMTFFNGHSDLSLFSLIIHQLIYIVFCYIYFSFLVVKKKNKYIVEYLIFAFAIQSIIQYLSFLIPSFNNFSDLFKSEETILLKSQYSGFRLNAIAGGYAFNLAMGYAVVLTTFIFRWKSLRIRHKFSMLLLLLLGAFAAGRISIVCFAISAIILLIKKAIDGTIKLKFIIRMVVGLIAFTLVLVIGLTIIKSIAPSEFLSKIETVEEWSTKWIGEYLTNSRTSDGYDFWSDNYSKIYSIENTFIFGDGLFTNDNGTYYLRADAGYVRILGYGGVLLLALLFVYQLLFLSFKGKHTVESIAILIIIIISTLKADCLAICIQTQLVLTIMYLNDNYTRKSSKTYMYRERMLLYYGIRA